MNYFLTCVSLLCLSFVIADEPPPAPQNYDWCYNRHPAICVDADVNTGTTIQYPTESDNTTSHLIEWHLAEWYRKNTLYVSTDGRHAVTTYAGEDLLNYDDYDNPATIMLELWRAPEHASDDHQKNEAMSVQQITLGMLIADSDNLRATVSHWHWGEIRRGYDEAQDTLLDFLEIATVENRVFRFDMLTGELNEQTQTP